MSKKNIKKAIALLEKESSNYSVESAIIILKASLKKEKTPYDYTMAPENYPQYDSFYDEIIETEDVNIEIIDKLYMVEDSSLSYNKRRKALTKVLKIVSDITFDYEKKDCSSRSVSVSYNEDYTYDKPKKEDNFIYMYDVDNDLFKHFKLDKISNIKFNI